MRMARMKWLGEKVAIARNDGGIIFKIAAVALPWCNNPISGPSDGGNAIWTNPAAKRSCSMDRHRGALDVTKFISRKALVVPRGGGGATASNENSTYIFVVENVMLYF